MEIPTHTAVEDVLDPQVEPATLEIAGVYELGQGDEPSPMEWLADGLLPEGHITILSGDGGLGKSYVALYLALCVLRGEPFFGRPVKRGNVLWVDAEGMGKDEVERRLFEIARGAKLDRPSKGLYYYAPIRGLGDETVQAAIKGAINAHDVKLAILDSFSMGAAGSDVSSQEDTVGLLQQIQQWGTTSLLLDHITKAASKGDQSQATIFGSVFKRNGARSTLRLTGCEENVRELIQDKSNFGPNTGGVRYEMRFEQDDDKRKVVRFEHLGEVQPQVKKVKKAARYQTLDVLLDLSEDGGPVSVASIAVTRDIAASTVSNHLSALSGEGLVTPNGDKTYSPVVEE